MNQQSASLSRRYQAALQSYAKQGLPSALRTVRKVADEALASGLDTLDLAKMHERALAALDLANSADGLLKRSQIFFAEAITPIEETHRAALEVQAHMDKLNKRLSRRTVDLAASNRQLKEEIVQRRAIERSLRKSKRHYGTLLAQASRLQEQLRRLSRLILSAQEEERKKISRKLHDVISQTLTGISIQLAKLKKEAAVNTESLEENISNTQREVERSVNIVHQFARELRPTVLDDLGLIPALHSFLKGFREQSGINVSLTATAEVEHLNNAKRTVLFRVAQEALTNVARHAGASRAEAWIKKLSGGVCLIIRDEGKGFEAGPALRVKKTTRLGLLGMRERVEMVGGKLTIESVLGRGTTIKAQIPFNGGKGSMS